jgi:carbonic anhydrase
MQLEKLAKSHKEFKEKYLSEYATRFQELAVKGQSPKVLFISCSDSRVIPNLITHTNPGDLFIDRNVGNLVPPFQPGSECTAVSASIEYAVAHLQVEDIIVCGHSFCGACKALYEESDPNDTKTEHLTRWLEYAKESKLSALAMVGREDKDALLRATERFNVIAQLKNLLSYHVVQDALEEGKLFIQGWYYHIESGDLEYFDPIEHRFKALDEIDIKTD